MVTIPVSMYQTVVTNIQNLSEAGIPVTAMSALTAAATSEHTEVQENDASTTTGEEMKAVNGNQSTEETESH